MVFQSVFTYRKCNLTQFVCPVVQLLSVHSKDVNLLCGLNKEWSCVSGTAIQLQLRHADAVGQTDHLEFINLQMSFKTQVTTGYRLAC